MSDSLSRPISYSIAIHLVLLATLFLKMTFFPSEPIQIKRAMRVDLVALPDKASPAPAPAPAAAPKPAPAPKVDVPKPEVKAKPKPAPKKKDRAKQIEKSQESAVNRLKAMEALEKIKAEQEEKRAQEFKGNQVSKGNSLTGLEQIEYDRYFDQVEQLVYSNWTLPEWLANTDLRAQALVLVDKTGNVVEKKILKSSGNESFDTQVLSSIEKSSPFPAPPARLQGVLANQGFIFNFPD